MNERLQRKRLAYQRTFLDGSSNKLLPYADEVLADLRRVSAIDRGGLVISHVSQMVDPLATAYRAGQRDLFLRIVKFLELDGFRDEEQQHDGSESGQPE